MQYHIENRTFEIEYYWVPFKPGKNYLPNGDPGYPDEGGYAEDITAKYYSEYFGKWFEVDVFDLSEYHQVMINQKIIDTENDPEKEGKR